VVRVHSPQVHFRFFSRAFGKWLVVSALFSAPFVEASPELIPMPRQSKPWFRTSASSWYATLNGRKVSLGVSGKQNKKAATAAWHKLLSEGLKPSPEPKADVTVKAVIDAFLADAESRVASVTFEVYERFCRFFRADKGELKADALTLPMVEAWARKTEWSGSTRHDALGILATAFKWAERADLIARNPLVGIRKPPKASRGSKALISAGEHARLVACADPLFRAYLQLLWLTGARPGEIASLHAEEIDYQQGLVIREKHKEAHLGKSRVIFLSAEALAIIKGIGCESGLLFRGEDGQQMTAQAIGKRMQRLCIKAGIKSRTPYGYRHTFGTSALVNGVPDAHVAALMGHSGTNMLHRHYSHLTARARALRDALGKVR
jgi:integrase